MRATALPTSPHVARQLREAIEECAPGLERRPRPGNPQREVGDRVVTPFVERRRRHEIALLRAEHGAIDALQVVRLAVRIEIERAIDDGLQAGLVRAVGGEGLRVLETATNGTSART